MRIGFLGLGQMGRPMARRLAAAGHEVSAWNRSPLGAEAVAAGVRLCHDAAEAVRGAEVVLSMLADDRAAAAVWLGEGGGPAALEALAPEAVHAAMSTLGVACSRRLRDAHLARGRGYVGAPVFGRPDAAQAGKLWIVAGGPAAAVARCRPAFDALGQGVLAAGEEAPAAHAVKLCGNFVLAASIEALAEAFALARRAGMTAAAFAEILATVPLVAPIARVYAGLIAEERYAPAGFPVRLGLKDLRLVLEAGDSEGAPLPLASLCHDHLLELLSRGRGELDWAALGLRAAEAAGLGAAPRNSAARPD